MKQVNSGETASSDETPIDEWVLRVRAHGLAGAMAALLDALAPLAPMGAQALYVAQPAASVFHAPWSAMLGGLAHALETPASRESLRAALLAPEPPASADGS